MLTPDRRQPSPAELLPPWRTYARVVLQGEARSFAREVVLPIADELDRQKGEMPRSLIDAMAAKGWFGITIPSDSGGLGLGVFEYCLSRSSLRVPGYRWEAFSRAAKDSERRHSTQPAEANC